MAIASVNPTTGELLKSFKPLSADDIEKKLSLARRTFLTFRHTSFAERAAMMNRAADILENDSQRLGALMTTEMGKTLGSAIAEAKKCALGCRYYAEHAAKHLSDEVIETNASRSFVRYQPIGAILAIMPWNFPLWQVFRFAAPALMAGNVGLLKHSSNVPQCAMAIEEVLTRSGFPQGAFQTLLIESAGVEALIRDDRIAAVTLTGSEPAGRAVAAQAGSAIKKTVLELGGSDPFIVMPSVDLDGVVESAVSARVINNGQSCIAAKRFIIVGDIYEEFQERFVARMRSLRLGDPMQPQTEVGPLATSAIRDELHDQVQRAMKAGARLLAGGNKVDRPGYFYEPTVLASIPREEPIAKEEFFGPVAMLFRASHVEEAIEIANDSPFGLGASVWTRDENDVEPFVDGIEAGQVFINASVASDPRLPFGGIKRSGYGRELGVVGIREFVNAKTVWRK